MDHSESTAVGVAERQLSPAHRKSVLTKRPPVNRKPRLSPQAALREVMSRFATGVTVLTAGNGENQHGMTANAFTSVSLDPPLVLCCIAKASRMHETIVSAGCYAVSILGAGQRDLAGYFADWKRPQGRAQFDALAWERGHRTGAPLLCGALAWLECELVKVHDGGDHSIFVGEVLSSRRNTETEMEAPTPEALLFFGGKFRQLDEAA